MGFTKGVFGGSAARARWRLMRLSISLWIIVFLFSMLLYFFAGSPLWLLPEVYFSLLVVFQIWHWAAHQRWLFYPMWKVHVYHHWVIYPPKKFLSKVYKDDKAGRTTFTSLAHDGPLYLGVLANIAFLNAVELVRPLDCLAALVYIYLISAFTNFVHHATHVEGHWIEKFVYFHDLRALHYTHHQGTALHNFGILDFSGDIAGETLFAPNYELSNRKLNPEETAELCGHGNEHRSSVCPGPSPTVACNGLKEVAFYIIASSLEYSIGFLGLVFGAASETVDKNRRDVSTYESNFSKNENEILGVSKMKTTHHAPQIAPSHWGDFFLFN
jgi:hypothetical protein